MPNHRECVMLHVGQAGVQMSSACWELLCLEHGILPTGVRPIGRGLEDEEPCSAGAIFAERPEGTHIPRAILMDMEPTCIDEIRTGTYRHLFNPEFMISGKEDAANNFARGYYTAGREMIDAMEGRTRQVVEGCDNFQGFILTRSIAGGCGSGFTAFLLRRFGNIYGKRARVTVDLFPSPQIATSVVEPYNALFAIASSMDFIDVAFNMDNQALYEICYTALDNKRPSYANLNRLAAQAICGLTSSVRFPGSMNVELPDFQTNLVPFPRLHFPIISYAPLCSAEKAYHERFAVNSLIDSLFNPRNQLVSCDIKLGTTMGMGVLFRGDVTPNDLTTSLAAAKATGKISFADWAPAGIKIGLTYEPPVYVPGSDIAASHRSVIGISNSTAIKQPWELLTAKFEDLFAKRAFVHHYVGEGMEESEFYEVLENMKSLEAEFTAVEKDAGGPKKPKKKTEEFILYGKSIDEGPTNGPAKSAKRK